MSDFTDLAWQVMLDEAFADPYAGLLTSNTSGVFTELGTPGVNGYARGQVVLGAASGGIKTSTAAAIINTPTGIADTVCPWIGLYDAATGSNLLMVIPAGVNAEFEVLCDDSTDAISTAPDEHGFATNDRVCFDSIDGVLPGGLVAGVAYYVHTVTTTTFEVSTAASGSGPINITAANQRGAIVRRLVPLTAVAGSGIDFDAGAFEIGKG